jgi:hypothetical protein
MYEGSCTVHDRRHALALPLPGHEGRHPIFAIVQASVVLNGFQRGVNPALEVWCATIAERSPREGAKSHQPRMRKFMWLS